MADDLDDLEDAVFFEGPSGADLVDICMDEAVRALRRDRRTSRAQARAAVRSVIIPTIAAAFETYQELDVPDVLRRCEPCLVEALVTEFQFAAADSSGSLKPATPTHQD